MISVSSVIPLKLEFIGRDFDRGRKGRARGGGGSSAGGRGVGKAMENIAHLHKDLEFDVSHRSPDLRLHWHPQGSNLEQKWCASTGIVALGDYHFSIPGFVHRAHYM